MLNNNSQFIVNRISKGFLHLSVCISSLVKVDILDYACVFVCKNLIDPVLQRDAYSFSSNAAGHERGILAGHFCLCLSPVILTHTLLRLGGIEPRKDWKGDGRPEIKDLFFSPQNEK